MIHLSLERIVYRLKNTQVNNYLSKTYIKIKKKLIDIIKDVLISFRK